VDKRWDCWGVAVLRKLIRYLFTLRIFINLWWWIPYEKKIQERENAVILLEKNTRLSNFCCIF
jgi:hypothetical protein